MGALYASSEDERRIRTDFVAQTFRLIDILIVPSSLTDDNRERNLLRFVRVAKS